VLHNGWTLLSDGTIARFAVCVAVVRHSNGSVSRFPQHFFVHRGPSQYQNRSGSQDGHSRDWLRIATTPPASSAHIPHRDSERWGVPVHHDVHTQRQESSACI